MPVNFLTEDLIRRYGRYSFAPTEVQLSRYFHLDDHDRKSVMRKRGDHNRLGFALQLCTVRFLGTFLPDPTDVPAIVVDYLSKQLEIEDPTCLPRYMDRRITHHEHAQEIKRQYEYKDFNSQPEHFRLVRWIYVRAWSSVERPSIIFDLATARLIERKVLLPGASTLARLIASVRDRIAARLWRILAAAPNEEQKTRLVELLTVPDDARQSHMDRLRRAPTRVSGPGMVGALRRFEEIRSLEIGSLNLGRIPPCKIKTLARYAASAWAPNIARMPEERRIATLVAFARTFGIKALDDALDLLDLLITDIIADAKKLGVKERLRTLGDLDEAALDAGKISTILLDDSLDDTVEISKLREIAFSIVPRERLEKAVSTIATLARPRDDNYYPELRDRYRRVRWFLPTLLRTIHFQGTQASESILKALHFLSSIEGKRIPDMALAPLEVVPQAWRRLVIGPQCQIDRRAYTLCILEQLQDSLRRRDVFVSDGDRWGDPRAKLLQGKNWKSARSQVCRTLGRKMRPEDELEALGTQLDEAYHRTAENFPDNTAVRIENRDGRDRIVLTGLDKVEDPPSLIALRRQVTALIPRVELPEILLEIQYRTGFADEFTHVSEAEARVADLPVSISAVLLAEACNIGLEPLVREDVPALTRNRLGWVQQNYIRSETLIRSNARLVKEQTLIPLTQQWGGGEVASADGLRFVVPVRTINAGPNPKYFRTARGITYYNFTSDQFTGFHNIVIPGTLRDSIYILEGLLEHQTVLNPGEIMADTAGASDLVFGLFWLLGYLFSPRLADIGEARFWRMDPSSDYGVLNFLARNRISTGLIERNWDDMLRVAGSLKQQTVSASELIRSLLRSKRPSTLARAISELGRIPKTLFLLSYIDDENCRRRILTQINRGEGRHKLARTTFHGKRGEVRKRYREGQEDQLGALGLVVNAIVLWNTIYMDAALSYLRSSGIEVKSEDMARLSPLVHEKVNFLGRYSFTLPESIAKGQLRPLNHPELRAFTGALRP